MLLIPCKTESGGLFLSNLRVIVIFEKTTSSSLFMSNLCVIVILRKQQAAVSLFEQLVCHSISGIQQVAASLFEQLVYLQPYYYFSINWYLSGNLAEKFVMNLYLQKSVIHYQQIWYIFCLSLTLSCELTDILGQ